VWPSGADPDDGSVGGPVVEHLLDDGGDLVLADGDVHGDGRRGDVALLAKLEQGFTAGAVNTADVVRALREVRGSLETLGKFFVMVEDRPRKADASSGPEIDEAIVKALTARDVVVAQEESHSHWTWYREPSEIPGVST
jgi:hypothetical protein